MFGSDQIRKTTIGKRLMLSFLLVSLVPLLIAEFLTFYSLEKEFKDERIEDLRTIADSKKLLLSEYMREKTEDIKALSFTTVVMNLLEESHGAFLNGTMNSPEYTSRKAGARDFFKNYFRETEYYDSLLVDKDGNVVFTLKGEADLGSNLKSGPYRETELAKTFKLAVEKGETRISDFKYYPPSGIPAAFIGAPVRRGGAVIGAVMLQLDNENIYREVRNYGGLGNTGEIVLAAREGDEAVYISPLRHDPDAAYKRRVRLGSDKAIPVQRAVLGETGDGVSIDYRGREILAAWRYLPELRWGIVVKIDSDEAYARINQLRLRTFFIGILTALLVVLTAYRISKSISAPIKALQKGSVIIGNGNLDYKTGTDAEDEIGQLSRSFDEMTVKLKSSRENLENEIAGRRQVESYLRKEKDKLRKYLDISAVMVVMIDAEQKVTLINRKGCEILGYEEQEIIGRNWFDNFLPQRIRDEVRSVFLKIISGDIEPFENYENPVLTRSGEERTIAWYNTVFRDNDGNIQATLASGADITERIKAEQLIRESELWLSNIYNSLSEAVLVVTPERVLSRVNRAAEKIYGYSGDEMLGRSTEMLHADHQHYLEFGRRIKEAFDRDETAMFEFTGKRKNGEIFPTEHTVSLLKDASGRQIGIVSVVRDITERMKADEKLKSINREMEQIIQVTSHDLRTPLAVVNGYSREMEKFIEKLSPVLEKEGIDPSLKKALNTVQSDIRDTLKYIQSNTRKMDSLLYGLLKLSRSGRVELNIEELDMNNLMAEVLSAFGPQIMETKAALDISELPSCRGDEAQINQVFSNLIGNALKYLDPGRPCCIRISGLKQAGRSVYCVEDNGIGIAPEHHEKIFEIFHQVRRSPGSGEGLGLTMVQKIVERHNGSIWLESEPGKGSRFFVSLPS